MSGVSPRKVTQGEEVQVKGDHYRIVPLRYDNIIERGTGPNLLLTSFHATVVPLE